MLNINLFPLSKHSGFSFIPELDVPMPRQNFDPVGLISNVPPLPVYIHQLKIMPNPMKVIKYKDMIQGRKKCMNFLKLLELFSDSRVNKITNSPKKSMQTYYLYQALHMQTGLQQQHGNP